MSTSTIRSIVITTSIVVLIVVAILGIAINRSNLTLYSEVTILDLYRTEWDMNSTQIVGRYKGRTIRKNQFEVWGWRGAWATSEPKPPLRVFDDVVSCNRVEGWMLMRLENNTFQCSPWLGCPFDTVLKVLDEDGNVLLTIK